MRAGRDIHISSGPSAEQIRAIVREALAGQGNPAELAKSLGITETAVANVFRILKEQTVPPEKRPEKPAEIAERHLALVEQLQTPQAGDPAVAKLRAEAAGAIEQGDYPRAESLLAEAEEKDLAASRKLRETLDQRLLSAAATRAQRGGLGLTRLDSPAAAAHFQAAAGLVPPALAEQRLKYLDRHADALYRRGDEKGDNAVLQEAIEAYRRLLAERPRARVPLAWAGTQNNLGTALWTLDERESGTARLEAAVVAYRNALPVFEAAKATFYIEMARKSLDRAAAEIGKRRPEGSPMRAGGRPE